jgi:hypothetical protein
MAAAAAPPIPRQAGKYPMITVMAVGPPVKTGGKGCITLSVIRAAGGILLFSPFILIRFALMRRFPN